jgi:hypothetical protein
MSSLTAAACGQPIAGQSRRRDVEDDSLELHLHWRVFSAQTCVASLAALRIRKGMTTHCADFGSAFPCCPSDDTGDRWAYAHSVKSLPCPEALERNATRFQGLLLRAGIRFGNAICILARPKPWMRCCAPRPTLSIGLEVALWSTNRAGAAAVTPISSTTTLVAETLGL